MVRFDFGQAQTLRNPHVLLCTLWLLAAVRLTLPARVTFLKQLLRYDTTMVSLTPREDYVGVAAG